MHILAWPSSVKRLCLYRGDIGVIFLLHFVGHTLIVSDIAFG
jgi:hypothetical protein